MPRPLITIKGCTLEIGEVLGRGGEGTVYSLRNRPDEALKLYHQGRIEPNYRRKLEVMVELATPGLIRHSAWPIDLVESGAFGVLMPRVREGIEIHDVYGPKSRMTKLPHAGFRFLVLVAYNLCVAVNEIHGAGVVIGDFNQRNILVDRDARVRFVDCDSFQIRRGNELFRCEVGTPDQLAPEVHNRPLDRIIREPEHDNFTLAVIIFQLLFAGRHPFAGVGGPDLEPPEAIRRYLYAYGSQGAKAGVCPPPHAPPLDLVSPSILKLFDRAFAPPTERIGRPKASDWGKELQYALEHMVRCRVSATHEFVAGRMNCPWCELQFKFNLVFFVAENDAVGGRTSTDFIGLAHQLLQTQPPAWRGRTRPRGQIVPLAAPPVTNVWPASYWFGLVLLGLAAVALCNGHWIVAILIVAWGVHAALAHLPTRQALLDPARKAVDDALRQRKKIDDELDELSVQIAQQFTERRTRISTLRAEYENLGNEKTKRYAALQQQHAQLQLEQYLDRFFIAHASIPGFGTRRKDILLSYNIETARDIRVGMGIPGVGPDLEARLMNWRASLAQGFRFNPSQKIDQREYQTIDATLATRKQELEHKLAALKEELDQAIRGSKQELQTRSVKFDAADDLLAQKQAELAALTNASQGNPTAGPKLLLGIWTLALLIAVVVRLSPAPTRPVATPLAEVPKNPPTVLLGKLVVITGVTADLEIYRLIEGNAPQLVKRYPKITQSIELDAVAVGTYLVVAQADGWRGRKSATVEVPSGIPVELVLPFETTSLMFESAPSGATVLEDGRILGTTPFRLSGVPVEKHSYVFHLDGFPDRSVEAGLGAGSQNVIQVWPVGEARIESDPMGAEVKRGDQFLGTTPLMLANLAPGPYQFTVSRDEYLPQELCGTVEAQKTLNLSAALVDARPLRLTVEAAPYSSALKITNRSDRTAKVQTVIVSRDGEYTVAELTPDLIIAPQQTAGLQLPSALPPNAQVKITCERAVVELEMVRLAKPEAVSADELPPRSIFIRLERRSQTLHFRNRSKAKVLIQRIELTMKSDNTRRVVQVNKVLAPGLYMPIKLRTTPDEDYSFSVVADPPLLKGAIEFSPR